MKACEELLSIKDRKDPSSKMAISPSSSFLEGYFIVKLTRRNKLDIKSLLPPAPAYN